MILNLIKQHKLVSLGLLIINIVPLLLLAANAFELMEIAFFYWSEIALVLAIAVLPYTKHFIVFFFMLVTVTLITRVADPSTTGNLNVLLTFWGLYCFSWLIYIEIVKTRYWQKERRKTPSEQFLAYLIFMVLAIGICFSITISIYDGWDIVFKSSYRYFMFFFSTAVVVPTFSIGLLNIIDMIGPRHFLHFLVGTYHQPVRRDRIVLFLDMVGSTAMAERMPPEKGMALIAMFIHDAGAIFRRHQGDIVNYTGDGLVVLWPRRGANRALASAYELHMWVNSKRKEYLKEFGYAPDFRVGIHAGVVIMGQIGEEKLFIGLYGDVVNTAARIEQLNKSLGTKILLSRDATKFMDNHWLVRLKKVGEQDIRGRKKPVRVYTLKNIKIQPPSTEEEEAKTSDENTTTAPAPSQTTTAPINNDPQKA